MKLERTPFAPHAPHLLELLDALKNAEIPLYLIGGFGLYLRRMFHEQQLTPPLFKTDWVYYQKKTSRHLLKCFKRLFQ